MKLFKFSILVLFFLFTFCAFSQSSNWFVLTKGGSVYKNGTKIDSGYKGIDIASEGDNYYILTAGGSVYKNGTKIDSGYKGINIAAAGNDYYVLTEGGSVYKSGKKNRLRI
ncbi:histidine phosphatase family protein [Marinigracilibium pacificum]|uniref:Uncharacterized protein n=1 Tax=Marinigracilibium pacificum TaxID=2729599 RepID=A0A848J124_9BACT|nr:hypothetical protein [Marinigracilibium pacificum]NMM49058.1 hypothetical protein [Marinigracilibium pacificum]